MPGIVRGQSFDIRLSSLHVASMESHAKACKMLNDVRTMAQTFETLGWMHCGI